MLKIAAIIFFAIMLFGCSAPLAPPFPKECAQFEGAYQRMCIFNASQKANSTDICNYINDTFQKENCKITVLVGKGDYNNCNSLQQNSGDECRAQLATEMSQCEKEIFNYVPRQECIAHVVTTKSDIKACEELPGRASPCASLYPGYICDSPRDNCAGYYIAYTKYPECRQVLYIQYDTAKFYSSCIINLAFKTYNPMLCEDSGLPLVGKELIASCYRMYAILDGSEKYCDKAYEFQPDATLRDICKRTAQSETYVVDRSEIVIT